MTARGQGAEGPLLFARYAFAPNELGYCGGDDDRALFEYGVEDIVDAGLLELEQRFEGAYPYLQLIARLNAIDDPLDRRVVEAYWIGNSLLHGVGSSAMYAAVEERFRPRLAERDWPWLARKAPAGALPHHSFHVLEIYPRIGMMRSGARDRVLETIQRCCVRPARVREVQGANLLVASQPLIVRNGRLTLGEPALEMVRRQIDGRGFVDGARAGDWVSIHWGWACDWLGDEQRVNLERYTRRHIAVCNQTL